MISDEPALYIGSIVIRVDDLDRQMAFWTAALGYAAREAPSEDWVVLRPASGHGPNVSLDKRRSEVHLPPRIHIDLYSDDQAAEVERLIGLGAKRIYWNRRRVPTSSRSKTLRATASTSCNCPSGREPFAAPKAPSRAGRTTRRRHRQ